MARRRSILRIALAAAVVALAACSSPSSAPATAHSAAPAAAASPTAPPSAMTLLERIPGVTQCAPETPDPEDLTLAFCESADGSAIELATFATQADEMQWLADGGSGGGPLTRPTPAAASRATGGRRQSVPRTTWSRDRLLSSRHSAAGWSTARQGVIR